MIDQTTSSDKESNEDQMIVHQKKLRKSDDEIDKSLKYQSVALYIKCVYVCCLECNSNLNQIKSLCLT